METYTEQKAQHTAGQWNIGKPDPIGARAFYTTKDGHASVLGYAYAYGGEGEANARLIASAPKLLKMVELLSDSYEYWMARYQPEAIQSQMMLDAKDLIKQVKGEA